ncbi:MAG: diguanylate cyclase, partial [Candidatus Sumerlaeota bacterium]
EEMSHWVDELKQTSHEIALLNQMSDLLQACQTVDETDAVVMQLMEQLFPEDAGMLARYVSDQNYLEPVALWGEPESVESDFAVEDCWALRRGKVHDVARHEDKLLCRHLTGEPPEGYMCVPLMAQGELLGLMHLEWSAIDASLSEDSREAQLQSKKSLLRTVTEQLALALANLKLREQLRAQSIRDQLTGLYNRRYMEEALTRELHRAQRAQQTLGIIMLDVDHFKVFNDNYGHEDGDLLLRELGAILRESVRQEDIACRYGGEEFLVILPDAPRDIVTQRAEGLRRKVESGLRVKKQAVTISLGVALYPDHGLTAELLLNHADQALYMAKDQGRNRVVVWQEEEDSRQ